MIRLSTSAWLFAVVGCLGCAAEKEPDRKLESAEGFCQLWAERACTDPVVDRCSAPDPDACRSGQAEFCESIVPAPSYTQEGAEECLDAVEAAYEDQSLDPEEFATVRELGPPCNLVISGSGDVGDDCDTHAECSRQSGLSCVHPTPDAQGTCQEAVEVGGGLACDDPGTVCADGFYCDGENCLANKGEGDECSPAIPCGADFKCALPEGAAGGDAGAAEPTECIARLGAGSDCEESIDCVSGICSGGVCANNVNLDTANPICSDLR